MGLGMGWWLFWLGAEIKMGSLVPRPPPFFCSSVCIISIIHGSGRAAVFRRSSASMYYTNNANQRTTNGGGLGTKLRNGHSTKCKAWDETRLLMITYSGVPRTYDL